MPEAAIAMQHVLTARCAGDNAQECYSRGLALAKDATTPDQRHEAVSLISEACAAKIEAACGTLDSRLKLPRRIAGLAPHYTAKALEMGVEGKFLVRCILPDTGVLDGCKIEPPTGETERRRFVESKFERDLLAAFGTWRLTPALFDDRPFPFDFVSRLNFVYPRIVKSPP
jgi:hypothetical protein